MLHTRSALWRSKKLGGYSRGKFDCCRFFGLLLAFLLPLSFARGSFAYDYFFGCAMLWVQLFLQGSTWIRLLSPQYRSPSNAVYLGVFWANLTVGVVWDTLHHFRSNPPLGYYIYVTQVLIKSRTFGYDSLRSFVVPDKSVTFLPVTLYGPSKLYLRNEVQTGSITRHKGLSFFNLGMYKKEGNWQTAPVSSLKNNSLCLPLGYRYAYWVSYSPTKTTHCFL